MTTFTFTTASGHNNNLKALNKRQAVRLYFKTNSLTDCVTNINYNGKKTETRKGSAQASR